MPKPCFYLIPPLFVKRVGENFSREMMRFAHVQGGPTGFYTGNWGRYLNDVRTGRGEGGTQKADESTDKLRECESDRGGQNIWKFCGHHLSMAS